MWRLIRSFMFVIFQEIILNNGIQCISCCIVVNCCKLVYTSKIVKLCTKQKLIKLYLYVSREYSTHRVVTTGRLKAPRNLVVHDNLIMFTKYSERSVHNLKGLPQCTLHSWILYNLILSYTSSSIGDQRR